MTPPVTSGLVLELEATNISATDGNSLSTWSDVSGNNNDASQTTSSNQPTYNASAFPDAAGVNFGSDQWFNIASSSELDITDFTIFIIFSSSMDGTSDDIGAVFNKQSTSGTYNDRNWWFAIDNGFGFGNTDSISLRTSSSGSVISLDATSNVNDGGNYRVTGEVDATDDLGAIRVEGTDEDSQSGVGAADGQGAPIIIGSEITNETSRGFDGDIGAIFVYDRSLTQTEINDVESYLDTEYIQTSVSTSVTTPLSSPNGSSFIPGVTSIGVGDNLVSSPLSGPSATSNAPSVTSDVGATVAPSLDVFQASSPVPVVDELTDVSLSWSATTDPHDGQKIYRAIQHDSIPLYPNDYTQIDDVGVGIESYIDSGISRESIAWYAITAYNSETESEPIKQEVSLSVPAYGIVTDPISERVQGTTVKAVKQDNSTVVYDTTDFDGFYSFPNLSSGTWDILFRYSKNGQLYNTDIADGVDSQ